MAYVDQLGEPAVAFYYAICLFTGIRGGYMGGEFRTLGKKIAAEGPDVYFRMDIGRLYLPRGFTLEMRQRWIELQPNVLAWPKKYPPTEEMFAIDAMHRHTRSIRKQFSIPEYGLRHTFGCALAAIYGEVWAEERGGLPAKFIRNHLFKRFSCADAQAFWGILPA